MKYIHEEPYWPNFKWDMKKLAAPLARASHKHGILMGQVSALPQTVRAKTELETLTNEIMAISMLAGDDLERTNVRSALAKRLDLDIGENNDPDPISEGYAYILLDATKSCTVPLNSERLFAWYNAIYPASQGDVRAIINDVLRTAKKGVKEVITGHIKNERMDYEPPAPSRLPENMKSFLDWANMLYNNPAAQNAVPPKDSIHPMVEAGIAYLWIIAIHPFNRSNNLFGQAIANLFLTRYTSCHGLFYSISAQVEKNRKYYYDILNNSLQNGLEITNWLLLFIDTLTNAVVDSLEKFSIIIHKVQIWEASSLHPLNQRQKLILHYMLDNSKETITTIQYAKIAKCSPDTALRDIRDFISFNILQRNPERGRNASYQLIMDVK